MKKTLIQPANLDKHICRKEKRIFVDGASAILTPGARDELAKRGIRVLPGSCPDGPACCGQDAAEMLPGADARGEEALKKLLSQVAVILKDEYGVTDPERLRSLTLKTLEVIRNSL